MAEGPSDKHMKMKLGLSGDKTAVVAEKMKIKMKLKMTTNDAADSPSSGEKLSEDAYEKLKMKLKLPPSAKELERMKLKMKQDKMQPDQSHDAMKLKMNMKLQTNDARAKPNTASDTKAEKMKMKMTSGSSQATGESTSHDSCSVSLLQGQTKPPNVLVYAEDVMTRNSFLVMLKFILAKDLYTVYPLSLQETKKRIWIDNAALLVVCGDVNKEVTAILMDYLFAGGKLLCLCSNLLYQVLPIFQGMQVKDHEMVEVSLPKWEKIMVMHRVYSNVSADAVCRCAELIDSNGAKHKIHLSVISAENTSNTPSILLINNLPGNGTAIFSQIHLETNPLIFKNDNVKFNMLLSFEKIRMSILSELFQTHLQIDVANLADAADWSVMYSRAFLIGAEEAKLWALQSLKDRMTNDHVLATPHYKIHLYGKDDVVPEASSSVLPLQVDGIPDDLGFSTKLYFEELKTQEVGRLLIYATLLTSSMNVLSHLTLSHGFCVIPRQQTQGTGRSKNQWLSPEGCAMFSMQLHVPLSSPLGQRITLVQHLVAVAIVHGIISLPGYNDLNIRLKWPNDIYANGSTKIGGLMINTSIDATKAILNIGCGINLSNSNPTVCINDLIQTYNARTGKRLALLEHERFFAIIFNEIESLFNRVQSGDFDYLYKLYYKYWLHGNAEVKIHVQDDSEKPAKVLGIDKLGYLMVQIQESIESVHPDGNSFDMLRGLIVPKVH